MNKSLLLLPLLLAGCVQTYTGMGTGLVYNSIKDKAYYTEVDNTVKSVKSGSSCTTAILGLVSFGDSSLETAKKEGNISKISFIDKKNKDIRLIWLPLYAEGCTIVHGE